MSIEQLYKDSEVLTLIRYFHIFRHPLKLEELKKYSCSQQQPAQLEAYLLELVQAGIIRQQGEFFSLEGDEAHIQKRLMGETKAGALLPKAIKVARFLSLFPFVRFVGISGSLSKGYADEHTDFDFFIITASNTLWICRTLLHVAKKLSFLVGRQHWLCMNYFMDEQRLEIEEQNIFTRIELSTLIPVYNQKLYKLLLLKNSDNLSNLPNMDINFERSDYEAAARKPRNHNKLWQPLNLALMALTDRKWKSKWKKKGYPMEDYPLAFKTTPYISKNHPKNYQKNILNQLQKAKP